MHGTSMDVRRKKTVLGQPRATGLEAPAPSARPERRRIWAPHVVLALALCITAAATAYFARQVQDDERLRFEEDAADMQRGIEQRIQKYIDALYAGSSLFAAERQVDAREWSRFASALALDRRYPGVQGVGWTSLVRAGQEDEFERWMHTQGFEDFRIWPEQDTDHQPVTFLQPFDQRNRAAMGFDMASEPVRLAAMKRARDTGAAAATGSVVLVQEIDADVQRGFLIYVPVYRAGAPTETVEERREALIGFVYAPFRVRDLFDATIKPTAEEPIALRVRDGTSLDRASIVYESPSFTDPKNDDVPSHLVLRRTMDVAGRTWLITYVPTRDFHGYAKHDVVALVLVGGLAISFLFAGLVWTESRARAVMERTATELHRSEDALRRMNQAKDEFLAMLGHELRNPLAATHTALEMLRMAKIDDPDAHMALQVAERQVRHQTRLVDDLLDVSRVSRGRIELKRSVVDLRDVATRAAEAMRSSASARQQELTISVPDVPVPVDGDPTRLEQIVSNLLTNATKYTPEGGHVRVVVERDGPTSVVRVKDDGIGIDPEALERIFGLFEQLDTSIDRSAGGLGLGLTLALRLVELHGGSLEASSEGRGRGSEFVVRLPAVELPIEARVSEPVASSPSAAAATDGHGHDGLRIVIVEDNADARVLLEQLLERQGHDVETATDGETGVELALHAKPDVALVDIGLPAMDGYEVARRLRKDLGSDVLLVAVSGYSQAEDRRRAYQAGFDHHLAKPLDGRRLRELLDGWRERRNLQRHDSQVHA